MPEPDVPVREPPRSASARTRTVDSHASRLRRKLAALGGGEGLVVNVWGIGYRLLPEEV